MNSNTVTMEQTKREPRRRCSHSKQQYHHQQPLYQQKQQKHHHQHQKEHKSIIDTQLATIDSDSDQAESVVLTEVVKHQIRSRTNSAGSTRDCFYADTNYKKAAPPAQPLPSSRRSSAKRNNCSELWKESKNEVPNNFVSKDNQHASTHFTVLSASNGAAAKTTKAEIEGASSRDGSFYFTQQSKNDNATSDISVVVGDGFLDECRPVFGYGTSLKDSMMPQKNDVSSNLANPSLSENDEFAHYPSSQMEQIRYFSSMALNGSPVFEKNDKSFSYISQCAIPELPLPARKNSQKINDDSKLLRMSQSTKIKGEGGYESEDYTFLMNTDSLRDGLKNIPVGQSPRSMKWMEIIFSFFDPTELLMSDVLCDENGMKYFDAKAITVAAGLRHFFFNPLTPEFTSLQQFNWAIIIGIVMGLYTSFWKWFIEFGVKLFWDTVPNQLYKWGFFTDPDESFPMFHYVWICPMMLASILSGIVAIYPLPGQDDWITSVHTKGVIDHNTFFPVFFISTFAMWSGLSLGPELPLVLTGGMFGSCFAVMTKQSVLQARVLNLTAASAAVGGFFGFPMAGALFVLEIPHRMGLQYFEALSPSTISTIAAVLTSSLVIGNDVTGYFKFPFLTSSLPSWMFMDSIVYGFYGAFVGIFYVTFVKKLKHFVHDLLPPNSSVSHKPAATIATTITSTKSSTNVLEGGSAGEVMPLLSHNGAQIFHPTQKHGEGMHGLAFYVDRNKAIRASVIGALVGIVVGVTGIFLPQTLFWGEAQLQNLIDKGRTPLPIFSTDAAEPTSAFTQLAMCMVDSNNPESIKFGFSVGCASVLVIAKTFVIGCSVGTGIVGGQFWGPLYVGCAAAHLLNDVMTWTNSNFNIGGSIVAYPCVAMLCTMGGAHVVMFRSHMGIMLILTLTISAFNAGNDPIKQLGLAGDYSAIFPLLVVSVFISLMASRHTIMYSSQRSRGDITAVPEVLCQPNMTGSPVFLHYEVSDDSYDTNSDDESSYDGDDSDESTMDIEVAKTDSENITRRQQESHSFSTDGRCSTEVCNEATSSRSRLDELLCLPIEKHENMLDKSNNSHRRSHSLPVPPPPISRSQEILRGNGSRLQSNSPVVRESKHHERTNSKERFVRVVAFGNIDEPQPSLLDQARLQSGSVTGAVGDISPRNLHRRIPSIPGQISLGLNGSDTARTVTTLSSTSSTITKDSPRRGKTVLSRKQSRGYDAIPRPSVQTSSPSDIAGALSMDDIEQSFNEILKTTKPPRVI